MLCLYATLPKSLLVWGAILCFFRLTRSNQSLQYLGVILGLFMASLTIFLNIRGDNRHLCPLPGKFTTIPYVLHLFIISVTFFCTYYQTCDCQLQSASSELTVVAFPMLMDEKELGTSFLFSSETGSDGMTQYGSLNIWSKLNVSVMEEKCILW